MKNLRIKIPAMIGMVLTLASVCLALASLLVVEPETAVPMGVGTSFALWIYSIIAALLSLPFYLFDAVVCVIRSVRKTDLWLNVVLAVMIIGSIPLLIFLGGSADTLCSVLWNVYYLLLFALELLSVTRIMKASRKK